MTTAECSVHDPLGLHARLATQIAQAAAAYRSRVTLAFGGVEANATDPMALMRLDVREGERVLVTADGPDEQDALAAVTRLL